MQKIPTLFLRDWNGDKSRVTRAVNPECQWVIAGEGVPTVKFDGTACLIQSGQLYKRYDAKHGKTPPPDFLPAQPEPDLETGHWPGWLPVSPEMPEDQHHRQAWGNMHPNERLDGTYELIGPKVQGNPYQLPYHFLRRHGEQPIIQVQVALAGTVDAYDFLHGFLATELIEGIVWHHPDGRRAKIKTRDFGLKWPHREESQP